MAHLVGLKVSDEVPLYVVGQLRLFCQQLLDAALAEYALPRVVCLSQCFYRVELGDSHQRHALRYLGTQSVQSVGYHGWAACLPERSAGYTSMSMVSTIEAIS